MNDRILARVRRRLADLPQLAADLPLFILSGFTQPDGPSGSVPGSRPPLSLDVLDLADTRLKNRGYDPTADTAGPGRRHGVLPHLLLWVQLVSDEMTDTGYDHQQPDPDLPAVCAWLAFHSAWICEQHPEFPADVAALYKALHGDPDENPTCPHCGWEVEPQDGGTWFSCRGCSRTWARAAEEARLQREAENLVPLSYAAKVLGTPVKTLHYWVDRGWITDAGKDRRGRLYDLRALAELRAQVRQGQARDTPAAAAD